MGFFSDLIGGKETTVHPDPYGLGMKNYKMYVKNRKKQFELFARQYKYDREALQRSIEELQTQPVIPGGALKEFEQQSGKQEKAFSLGAANRGFYSSTVPGSMAGHARSRAYTSLMRHYGDRRQDRLDKLQMTYRAMPGQYTRGLGGLHSAMPSGMAGMLKSRALMGAAPYSVRTGGMFGGVGDALFGAAGSAIGGGLLGLI
tara:strand:- start:6631 stop:7236 length:606 start_codon:yes stop_codon:yes gene_type:complete